MMELYGWGCDDCMQLWEGDQHPNERTRPVGYHTDSEGSICAGEPFRVYRERQE